MVWPSAWNARPATLSGGEQQRVAIARAVIGRPEILVADEPTGNVDPDMAVKLLRLFEALNRLGTTVLVATHDLHLLQKVPDSLIMRLDRGRLTDPTGALRFPPRRPARPAQGECRYEGLRLSSAGGFGGEAQARLIPQARLSGPMPWVIAIMVALTVIAAAAGLSLRNTANAAAAELSGGITVQIVEPDGAAREQQARAAIAKLRAHARGQLGAARAAG